MLHQLLFIVVFGSLALCFGFVGCLPVSVFEQAQHHKNALCPKTLFDTKQSMRKLVTSGPVLVGHDSMHFSVSLLILNYSASRALVTGVFVVEVCWNMLPFYISV